MKVWTPSAHDVGQIVIRACRMSPTVHVENQSGTQPAWAITFDARCYSAREVAEVIGAATVRHLATDIDATFDRFDICAAYLALENDWHKGGILWERFSNARRRESTGVQLHRIRYQPAGDAGSAWAYLENDNQRAIYVRALCRFLPWWDPVEHAEEDTPGRTSITAWILAQCDQSRTV